MRDPTLLGQLPDDIFRQLGLDTTRRVAMITRATIAHIFERRPFSHAASLISVLARRKFDPLYFGRQSDDQRLFFVVERTEGAERDAMVALKFLDSESAASGADEIWVSTAYLVEKSTLNRLLKSATFAVQRENRDR